MWNKNESWRGHGKKIFGALYSFMNGNISLTNLFQNNRPEHAIHQSQNIAHKNIYSFIIECKWQEHFKSSTLLALNPLKY